MSLSYPDKDQRVKFAVEGKVVETYSHDSCVKVIDDNGYNHYVFWTSSKATKEVLYDFKPNKGEVFTVSATEGSETGGNWLCVETYGTKKMLSATGNELSLANFERTYLKASKWSVSKAVLTRVPVK